MSVLDLPSRRTEAWRWADPEGIAAAAALPWSDAAVDADDYWLDLPGARLVFVDGVLDRAASVLGRVTLGAVAASEHALGKQAVGDGWLLAPAPNAAAEPVQIVHIARGGTNHLPAAITLGPGARALMVETLVGSGWSNRFTRIAMGDGAVLRRAVRLLQAGGFASLRDEATLGAGARLLTCVLGGGLAGSRVDAVVTLAGANGFVDYGGALLTRADQRQECAIAVRHAAPDGASRQTWRAVAADHSTASLAARVEVARGAQETDGEQSLRGLLLHRTATVNLKPELEIFADDVKCAHGATVGELDARALYYMESRGIAPARARALMTRAFVANALGRIEDETVRAAFEADADRWLEEALQSPSRSREGLGEGVNYAQ